MAIRCMRLRRRAFDPEGVGGDACAGRVAVLQGRGGDAVSDRMQVDILNDGLEWCRAKINNHLEWYLLSCGGYAIIFA